MFTDNQTTVAEDGADIELGMINQDEEHTVENLPAVQTADTITVWQVADGLRVLVFSKENCPRIASAVLLSGLSAGLNFLSPALLGESIHILSNDNETVVFAGAELSWLPIISMLVCSYGLAQVIPNICNQIMTPVTANNVKKLIQNSTKHLLEKSLHYHVNTLPADQFYFIQKGFTMSTIGTPMLTQIFPMMIQILVAGTLLSSQYGVELGASLIVLLGIYVGYSALTAKAVIKENDALLIAWNESYASLMAAIERYKIIHDYGKFDETMSKLDVVLARCWSDVFVRAATIPIRISYGHSAISYTHMLLAAMYVGQGIQSGRYTVQDFVVVIGYLLQLANLMPAFGQAINQLFASYPDLKFVFRELANNKDRMIDPYIGESFPHIVDAAPEIEFSGISFHHQPRPGEPHAPQVFKNLSFKVQSNRLVAIISESGVGKTTLFNLLYRYYPITQGSGLITINGQNIANIRLQDLRRNVAFFGKDPNLFKGSIRENILFGAPNPETVTDETIEDVARAANLYDFLQAFPQKLDTIIGPGGATLSDGQQQKVAILRGLMKKSTIWLLDEVTSSLDAESATQVLQTIRTAAHGVTSLMITHKLHEAAQYADEIVVIDKHNVVIQGKHDELLDSSPLYRNLWRKCNADQQSQRGTSSSIGIFSSLVNSGGGVNISSSDTGGASFMRLTRGADDEI